MKEIYNKYSPLLLLLVFLQACSVNHVSNEMEYNQWLNDESNGCIKQKEIKNIRYTAKYLPSSFLAMRENNISDEKRLDIDSLQQIYDQGINIYFRIDPVNDAKNIDIMYADVYNQDEFHQRVYDMNFNLQEMFSIEINGQKTHPSLFHLENDYGMNKGRGMNIVFPNPEPTQANLEFTLVLDDQLFSTGINKFKFKIEKTPKINN